ncbi:MAG: preprotein translocase subunit SecE [Candidatus Aminicenantes bacterium]|nr:preprotein translocase subunit SecE [Candidatus Aminicenantes bacterium]MDH5714206.1 preprotein translocase subunit SecE [Candidatus Aminicenantes bacterium]
MLKRIKSFMSEVKAETKRVTWPNRKEVYGTTIVVLIAVFIFAIFLYIVDIGLQQIVTSVLRYFGR